MKTCSSMRDFMLFFIIYSILEELTSFPFSLFNSTNGKTFSSSFSLMKCHWERKRVSSSRNRFVKMNSLQFMLKIEFFLVLLELVQYVLNGKFNRLLQPFYFLHEVHSELKIFTVSCNQYELRHKGMSPFVFSQYFSNSMDIYNEK
jgi:hypothetical protein